MKQIRLHTCTFTRLLVTVLTVCCLSYPSSAMTRDITLNLENVTLREAVKTLEKVSEYSVVIRSSNIDMEKRVSIMVKNQDIEKVAQTLFKGQNLSVKVSKNLVVVTDLKKEEPKEKFKISGTVKDSDGEPVIGAGILIDNSSKGTVSDHNGWFQLEILQTPVNLLISCIGWEDKKILVDGSETKPLEVILETARNYLDDVVVIGYGVQKKVNLTGSVAVRKMSEIANQPITHASQALYSMPGLYINQASSKPGSDGATIRVRGVGTIGNNNPMILVDGMEYSLNELNPNDIESISVLKDASASIYGSKAANGVILITTKQARASRPAVTLQANWGFQNPTYIPDVVNDPIQYMRLRNQAELNEGKLAVTYDEADILEYEEGMKHDPYIYPASDWYDICYKRGFVQSYNVNVSGGTNSISYSVSAGFMDQKGIMVNNDDARRYSWDIKLSSQINKRLRIGASVLGNLRYNTDPIYGIRTTTNVLNRALPIFGTRLPDGKYLSSWLSTPGRNNIENPLMEINEGNTKRQIQRFMGQLNLNYKLPFNIQFNSRIGYVKADHYSKDFKNEMYTYNPKTMEEQPFSAYVYSQDWDTNQIDFTFYNSLEWEKKISSGHSFKTMIGSEYKIYDNKNFRAKVRDFYNNQLNALSVGTTMDQIKGNWSKQKLMSVFGRFSYDYKERYLLDLTMRYDGSSKFAKGNRWSFFPALSLAWRIDKENFMSDISGIDLFKLRLSIGQMGNQAIGNDEYLMSVLAGTGYNYSFNDILSGGAAIKDFVDKDISWETTTSYNAGLDINAFKNRLIFGFDGYYKLTDGILRNVSIPAQIGNLDGPKRNIGKVSNAGVEVNLGWRDNVGDFSYALGGNFCWNKNKVVDIDGQENISTFTIIKEGYPIDSWYLYEADGFYADEEEIASTPNVGPGVKPGYIKYKDNNNNGKIDENDRRVVGNTVPSITYGFNISFGWKGLLFSADFQGVGDVDTYMSGNLAAPFWNGAGVLKEWATDAWTPENKNSRLPILHTATGAPEMHEYKNTQWLFDASYLRCKRLQLSYTLPEKWIRKIMSECQFFVNAENLFTISKLKMFDPEINLKATNIAQYPSLKTVNFGFNLKF